MWFWAGIPPLDFDKWVDFTQSLMYCIVLTMTLGGLRHEGHGK